MDIAQSCVWPYVLLYTHISSNFLTFKTIFLLVINQTIQYIFIYIPKLAAVEEYVDGLVQERRNSIANALELYVFLALPHWCNESCEMKSRGRQEMQDRWDRFIHISWWRHQMETFSSFGPLCGEFTGLRWIPRTKASNAELWCFLWSALIKRLSKHSRGWWWFETLLRPSWRHCNVTAGFWFCYFQILAWEIIKI